MSKKMRKTLKTKYYRIASICAAVVMVIGIVGIVAFNAFAAAVPEPFYGDQDEKSKQPEYKKEYILGRKLYNNTDRKFKVLEIAPNYSMGSLGYMMDNNFGPVRLSDIQALKGKISAGEYSALLLQWKQVIWFPVDGSGGGAYNHIDDTGYVKDWEYTVDGQLDSNNQPKVFYDRNYFAKALLDNSYLSNKMEFICKGPQDVTVEDVENADLIYISGSAHGGGNALYTKVRELLFKYLDKGDATTAANRAILDRYPDCSAQNLQSINDNNNISKEVAEAIIQHNVVNDKALLFDAASASGSISDADNISKVYAIVGGVDPEVLRKQFAGTPETDKYGNVIKFSGDIGYIDLVNFELHFVGPQLNIGYNLPIAINENNEFVLAKDANVGWLNVNNGHAGDKLTDFGIDVNVDQKLDWNEGMFAYQFASALFASAGTYTVNSYPYYTPKNDGIQRGYMNGSVYFFNGDNSITQDLYGNANYDPSRYPQIDSDYDKAEEIYGHTDGSNITNNEIIKYLLGIYPTKVQSVSVLEIQPSGFFEYSAIYSPLQKKNLDTRVVSDLQTAIDLMYAIGADTSILTSSNYERKVKITSLPANGYNGLITDLATEYDLIYIGTQTSAIAKNVRRRTNGANDYSIYSYSMKLENHRDSNLDGLIYKPIGDVASFGIGGLDSSNYDKITIAPIDLDNSMDYYKYTPGLARFSGNDFTDKAYNRLVEYCQGLNMPLMVADDIYNQNKSTIGSTTNVYKLGNLKEECTNFVKRSDGVLSHHFGLKDAYRAYVANRATVVVTDPTPIEYVQVSANSYTLFGTTVNDPHQVVKDGTGVVDKEMTIKGKITASVPAIYKVEMYVDRNGDGIYRTDLVVDDKNEIFANGFVRVNANGTLSLDGLEQEGFPFRIVGDRDFELDVTLPDALTGYFKWKLVLTEQQTKAQSCATGSFVVAAENKTVKVLQIVPDVLQSSYRNYTSISGGFNNLKDTNRNSVFVSFTSVVPADLKVKASVKDWAKAFEVYFEKVSDITGLELEVDMKTTRGYENMFIYDDSNTENIPLKQYRGISDFYDYNRNPLLANDYDMVVIGFADDYNKDTIGDKQGAVTLLKDFAAKGYSLLFTHDTMIYNDLSDGVAPMYSYYEHIAKKNNLSLNDAYDFGAHYDFFGNGSSFVSTTKGSAGFGIPSDKGGKTEKVYSIAYPAMIRVLRSVAGMDLTGVSTAFNADGTKNDSSKFYNTTGNYANPTIEINGKTYSYKELGQTQGMGEGILMKYANGDLTTGADYRRFPLGELFNGTDGFNSATMSGSGLLTTRVQKLNEGQITQYPYLIPDRLTVTKTHAQWYQLDLEGKEDLSEEVVVWYVLTNDDNKDNDDVATEVNKANDAQVSRYFEASGLDAVNNYYIYSKGNITFSGAGHTETMNQQPEMRLFINTIIRAITSGNSVPKAEFTSAVLTDEIRHAYTQYARDPENIVVSFKATDDDLRKAISQTDYAAGQFQSGFVYWDVNDNMIYDEGTDIVLKRYTIDPHVSNPDNILFNGIVREFNIADFTAAQYCSNGKSMKDVISGEDDIRIGAYATDSYGASGTATVKVVLRELFDLN